MYQKQLTTAQPHLNEDLCEGRQEVTQDKTTRNELVFTELENVSGNFETVEVTGPTGPVAKEKVMFELDFESLVEVEFADCTFDTEEELVTFLRTLTETQLRDTEVLEDDASFVVFYPLLPKKVDTSRKAPRSGYHFDTDAPRPTVPSEEVPELVGSFAEQFRFPGSEGAKTEARRAMLASIAI